MNPPGEKELILQCKSIIESVRLPDEDGDLTVNPKSVVYPEWLESFDNGDNIDALRSPNEDVFEEDVNGVTIQRKAVNAWLIDTLSILEEPKPLTDARGALINQPSGGRVDITYTFRLFWFYQYGKNGPQFVRDVIKYTRLAFRKNPKLGFTLETGAEYINGRHGGLQVKLMTEGDFKGVIAYVRGCNLTVKTFEPL